LAGDVAERTERPETMPSKVFISYRRDDSADHAGRVLMLDNGLLAASGWMHRHKVTGRDDHHPDNINKCGEQTYNRVTLNRPQARAGRSPR
jgi:hypothetical protein